MRRHALDKKVVKTTMTHLGAPALPCFFVNSFGDIGQHPHRAPARARSHQILASARLRAPNFCNLTFCPVVAQFFRGHDGTTPFTLPLLGELHNMLGLHGNWSLAQFSQKCTHLEVPPSPILTLMRSWFFCARNFPCSTTKTRSNQRFSSLLIFHTLLRCPIGPLLRRLRLGWGGGVLAFAL